MSEAAEGAPALDLPLLAVQDIRRPQPTEWQRALQSLQEDKLAIFGLVLIGVILAMAVLAPLIAPHDPSALTLDDKLKPPVFQTGGTWQYPLGTDQLGRDILSRLIFGARISLIVGLGTMLLGGLVGTSLGLISGYYGGWIDEGISMVAEIELAFPFILLALSLMAVLGTGLKNVIIALSVSSWVTYGRVVRAQVLVAKKMTYVEAAQVIGARPMRILFRHLLPNVAASIIVIGSFAIASAIMSEAFLSFLGLGVGLETPTWGSMLSEGRELIRVAWWPATLPGLAIMLTVLGINVVGDWLRDFIDPRMRI
jgi:peptide/nickel transport system permease protein